MKLFRFGLNLWITVVSLLSFLLGWAVLAHAPKPVQHNRAQVTINSPAVLPTLTPLQFGNGNDGTQNFQPPSSNFNNFNSAPGPIFSTGGS